jgi:hypothetical protein
MYLFPQVEVTLRPSVDQSVLVSSPHPKHATNFAFSLIFLLDIFGLFYFVAPSLARGRVAIHRQLHTHHHPSSGDGRRGQIVADVRSGLSLASTRTSKYAVCSSAACKALHVYLLQTQILLVDGGDYQRILRCVEPVTNAFNTV